MTMMQPGPRCAMLKQAPARAGDRGTESALAYRVPEPGDVPVSPALER
jgi:hypothetical protein